MMHNGLAHKILAARLPWRQRLLPRTVLYLIIPCLLPLLLVCLGVLSYVGAEARRHMEDTLQSSVDSASRKVEYYFAELEADMRFVASRLDHGQLTSAANKTLVVAFATTTHSDIATVWVREASGATDVLYSRREMLDRETPPAVDPEALGRERVGLTWHRTTRDEFGEPLLIGSAPILHPWENRPFGWLIFTVRPHFLQTVTEGMDLGTSGVAILVDREGQLISRSGGRATTLAGQNSATLPAMRHLLATTAEEPHSHDTGEQLVAHRTLSPLSWGIALQRDKAEIYAGRDTLAWWVIGAFAGLILLMVPLVISFSLRLTKPISALLHALQDFAAGHPFLRDEIPGQGELGLLADAFQHMAEQRQKSEQRYRQIVDNTNNLITQVDGEGRLLFVNHVGEKVFGVSSEQAHGMFAFDFVHPEDQEQTKAWFADCMARHLPQAAIENRQVSLADGRITHFLWNCHMIYDDSGQFQGMSGIAHDITERKIAEEEKEQMEERLRQSQKMEAIGTLAGGIAHDFNNILTPILGFAEIALAQVQPTDAVIDSLNAIHTAGLRAKDLVQQILAFSRRAVCERKPLLPHLVIKETLKFLRSSLPATIEVRADIATDCGMILGDPTQVQQIIMNLATNAYHAMRDKGGVLGITLKKLDISPEDKKVTGLDMEAGPYVKIEVSDTGCGMDRATMAKIFEPYFTTKKKGEGTGLGLATVHGIVKSYGGHVTVYSEPARGTTFHIYLPRVGSNQVREEDRPMRLGQLSGGNERILLVDDENQITAMLDRVLATLGYQVTVCNDSQEAWRMVESDPTSFDLLVTDMTMPHLTGLDLSKQVLGLRPNLPIILCTGFSELITREEARALGIREFLEKPMTPRDLAQAIRRALGDS